MPHKEERRGQEVVIHATNTSSTMVFTDTQITAFFTEATQMGISEHTRQALDDEGVSRVSNLHEWEDDEWDQFTQICKRAPQTFNPNKAQSLINQPTFKVPVKSLKRLKEASRISCSYNDVGRDLSQTNMRWNQVINNFMIQRKALEQKSKDYVPDVSKLQKGTTVASWAGSMRVFLSKVTSSQGIVTMAYVLRKEDQVPIVDPALAPDQPHLLEHVLVKDEYENSLLHSDLRFRNNNRTLFG